MIEFRFKSGLGPKLAEFIELKRAAGHIYDSSGSILRRFDAMAAEYFPEEKTVTKEVAAKWLDEKKTLAPAGLLRSVTPVRQFAKYLNVIGISAYVIPPNIPGSVERYTPHIFTEEELLAFFAAVDTCPFNPSCPTRSFVLPVYFRLVYSCGMRNSEARLLQRADLDLTTGKILIRESKGWKERIVYMHPDMLDQCVEYEKIMDARMPGRKWFFPNRGDVPFHRSAPSRWFCEFWDALPEASLVQGNHPRVHDLRHTFCVHRLNAWAMGGHDLNAMYPFLSEFLGHSSYAETDYYMHLTESYYAQYNRQMKDSITYPEVVRSDEAQ